VALLGRVKVEQEMMTSRELRREVTKQRNSSLGSSSQYLTQPRTTVLSSREYDRREGGSEGGEGRGKREEKRQEKHSHSKFKSIIKIFA
jgi:hypothetical protein